MTNGEPTMNDEPKKRTRSSAAVARSEAKRAQVELEKMHAAVLTMAVEWAAWLASDEHFPSAAMLEAMDGVLKVAGVELPAWRMTTRASC